MQENHHNCISEESLAAFRQWLRNNGRGRDTAQNYTAQLRELNEWLQGEPLTEASLTQWRQALLEAGRKPATVNAKIGAVNTWCKFTGLDLRAKQVPVESETSRAEDQTLTWEEYTSLLNTAERLGKKRLAMILETLVSTGVRISELHRITAEAVTAGELRLEKAEQTRVIPLSEELQNRLHDYAEDNRIVSGPLFITRGGKPVTRGMVWTELRNLAREAGVNPDKVYPRNLRYLFAWERYRVDQNVRELREALGNTWYTGVKRYLPEEDPERVTPAQAPEKFCFSCGARLRPGSRFCSHCGIRLE